jgi:acyl carrier protein
MSTRDTILGIISNVAPEAELEGIDDEADIRDELDIDSMDFLDVLVGVAERLGVEIPEADYGEVQTLAALVRYVDERRQGQPA